MNISRVWLWFAAAIFTTLALGVFLGASFELPHADTRPGEGWKPGTVMPAADLHLCTWWRWRTDNSGFELMPAWVKSYQVETVDRNTREKRTEWERSWFDFYSGISLPRPDYWIEDPTAAR